MTVSRYELLLIILLSIHIRCSSSIIDHPEYKISVILSGDLQGITTMQVQLTKDALTLVQEQKYRPRDPSLELHLDSFCGVGPTAACLGNYRIQVMGLDGTRQRLAAGECSAHIAQEAGSPSCTLAFDRFGWVGRTNPSVPDFYTYEYRALWGSDAAHVWLAGSSRPGKSSDSILMRLDASSPDPASRRFSPLPILPLNNGEHLSISAQTLTGLWGTGPNEVFAIGLLDLYNSTSSSITRRVLHIRDQGMTTESLVQTGEGPELPLAIWGDSAQDILVVGQLGLAYHSVETGSGIWTELSPPRLGQVSWNGSWGRSSSEIWRFGDQGRIERYFQGTDWQALSAPTNQNLRGAWSSASGDLWIVGDNGTVLRCQRDSCQLVPLNAGLPAGVHLRAIWGSAADDLWIAGTQGTLLHGDGTGQFRKLAAQNEIPALVSEDLNAVWGSAATDVWAAGSSGIILHYQRQQ